MKENADKYLEALTKKVFKKTSLDSPSFDFTNAVMAEVEKISETNAITYRPLISKSAWLIIAVVFTSIIGYLIFGLEWNSNGWFSTLDFSVVTNNQIVNSIPSFTMSKALMYAVIFFGLMLCIQITLLKHNFDKRFQI